MRNPDLLPGRVGLTGKKPMTNRERPRIWRRTANKIRADSFAQVSDEEEDEEAIGAKTRLDSTRLSVYFVRNLGIDKSPEESVKSRNPRVKFSPTSSVFLKREMFIKEKL